MLSSDMEPDFKKITSGIVENEPDYSEFVSRELHALECISEIRMWRSAEECYRDAKRTAVELFFIDIGLPGMSGSELIELLAREQAEAMIIVLTAFQSDDLILKCLKAGAVGYLLKSDTLRFGEIVRSVISGGAVMTPAIAARVLSAMRPRKTEAHRLSPREVQVLELIVDGYTPREIGNLFATAEGTVRNQIKSIYRKLQVSSRVDLMRKARDYGLGES